MRKFYTMMARSTKCLGVLLALGSLAVGVDAYGREVERDEHREDRGAERAERAQDKADRDSARSAERASDHSERDEARYQEDRAKIVEDSDKDTAKAQEELEKFESDFDEDQAKEAAEAAEEAADLAEDIAEAEADEYEDMVEEAGEDSDEDVVKAAAQDVEWGDSRALRDLGKSERPDYDRRGFPARRGEISALDLSANEIDMAQSKGFVIIGRHPLPSLESELIRLKAPDGVSVDQAMMTMRQIAPSAELDYTHYYGMQVVPAGKGAGKTKASPTPHNGNYTIGMIDTGVVAHDALSGHVLMTADFGQGSGAMPTDHGTAIASILASQGVNRLFAANIFRGGTETPFTSAEAIASALEWMMSNNVRVVNMSLSGPRNAVLDSLIKRSGAKGMLIVAAAGNGGPNAPPSYPAALSSVVAVTAVDNKNHVYRYANQGDYISIAARGVDVSAARAKGGWALFSGTSFATPYVAAWFAGCMSKTSAATCKTVMQRRAIDLGAPGRDPVYGHGLLH